MAARLVDLERDLGRVEDQVHLAGRALRRVEQRHRQLGGLLRVLGEVERAHRLEAARHHLPAERVRIAALLHLASRSRRSPRSRRRTRRSPARSARRLVEANVFDLATGHEGALADRDARHARHRRIGLHAGCRSLSSRLTANGSSRVRGAVGVGHRRRVVELDRLLLRRGPRHERSRPPRRRSGPPRPGRATALELKPHAPSTRTRTPKPALWFEVAASSCAVLDGQLLVAALHDADVGVVGAERGRRRRGRVRSVRSRRHPTL